jgi:hypothetical protein
MRDKQSLLPAAPGGPGLGGRGTRVSVRTNPICPGRSEGRILCRTRAEDVGRGRPTHEEPRGNRAKQSQLAAGGPSAGIPQYSTITSFQHSSLRQSCETKPLPARGDEEQVLCEKRVMTTWTSKGPRKDKANLAEEGRREEAKRRPLQTKPIRGRHGRDARDAHGRDAHATRRRRGRNGRDARDTHGRDAHATWRRRCRHGRSRP